MEAVNTVNGQMLWNFTHSAERVDIMNLYTAQFIQDVDGDGVRDLLNIHGGDPFGEPGQYIALTLSMQKSSSLSERLVKNDIFPF
jgi:hypothetical protein